MENKLLNEINKIIEEFKLLNIKNVLLGFSDGSFEQWNNNTRETTLLESNSILKTYNVKMLELFKEAIEGEVDLEDFEDRVNEFFGTKPHQILIVNKKVYKKNTLYITCGKEQCEDCYNMFTCEKVNKRKISLLVDIQPEYLRMKTKKDGQTMFGQTPEFVLRKKQNDHTQIFLGKLMYAAINSEYKLNGFGGMV
ncbi:MAG: hypothetical protein ACRCX2_21045 [Paraclostridium sp.]